MRNAKLIELFGNLGFKNVSAVISSGNILFESKSQNTSVLESKIEKALPAKLGFKSTTIIRSYDQLQSLIEKTHSKVMKRNKPD